MYRQPSLSGTHVGSVLGWLNEVQARERAQEIADELRVAAVSALDETKTRLPAMDHLHEIADVMTNRVRQER